MELIKGLTADQISQYSNIPSDSNLSVGVNGYKWAVRDELFTMYAATCLVPVVVNEEVDTLGIGHFLTSSAIKFRILKRPSMSLLDLYLDEASLVATQSGTHMYLFGGTFSGDQGFLQGTRNEVLRRFQDIGIECSDQTPSEPGLVLRLLVANIQDRTIRFHYEPVSKKID